MRRELLTDSGHILSVVKDAIAALPVGSKNISLHLNPDDLVLVENYASDLQKDWAFIGDANLLPGGCRVETKESLVDFTVETRMQHLLEEFEGKQLAAEESDAVVAEAEQQARLHAQRRDVTDSEGEIVAGQAQALAQDVLEGQEEQEVQDELGQEGQDGLERETQDGLEQETQDGLGQEGQDGLEQETQDDQELKEQGEGDERE